MASPPSKNHDQLKGDTGPSQTGIPVHDQRGWRGFGGKKLAIGAAVLIGVVWFFGPREMVDWQHVKEKAKELNPFRPSPPPNDASTHIDTYISPLSYGTDPDPSKTAHCKAPLDPTKPLVQYALMIDAGSTGSRIHIFKFNNCKASPTYEYEVFGMTRPGLHTFHEEPDRAAQSLDVLLDEALRVVPTSMHNCTPVAVKASGGLRLLPGNGQDILDAVEKRVRSLYPFPLPGHDGVVIMDSKDEGVFTWITANYLLGTIPPSPKSSVGKLRSGSTTYAVLDLGGGSTQIVFEPSLTSSLSSHSPLGPGEHKYNLQLSGNQYELYQHLHVGYGLMRARSRVHKLVDSIASIPPRPASQPQYHGYDKDGDDKPESKVIPNPCLARTTERTITLDEGDISRGRPCWSTKEVTMAGLDVGSFEACDRIVQRVLAKDTICETKPCSFNGVYQPSLRDSFQGGKVLLLSYFYDRIHPLLPSKGSSGSLLAPAPPLTVSSIATYASAICDGPATWEKVPHWASNKHLMEELKWRPEWCLDLTFMYGLLKWGYGFEETRPVELGKQIRGTELGWCLGATLALVGAGDAKCKA